MPEPENFNPTTSSTLAQLLEIDSQLSNQYAQLQAQLESLQHKRLSLQVVINLFSETDKATVATPIEKTTSTPQTQTEKQPQSVDESQVVDNGQVKLEPVAQFVQSIPLPTFTLTTVKKKATSTKKKSQTKKT